MSTIPSSACFSQYAPDLAALHSGSGPFAAALKHTAFVDNVHAGPRVFHTIHADLAARQHESGPFAAVLLGAVPAANAHHIALGVFHTIHADFAARHPESGPYAAAVLHGSVR